MARYIDAELIDFSCLKNEFDKARAKVIIMGQPTADVAPIADTVRKMRNRFSSLLGEEYRKYTPEDADRYFKSGAYMMRAIADRLIILIAKEMLEEKQ